MQKEPGAGRLLEAAIKIHVNKGKPIPWKAVGRDSAAAQAAISAVPMAQQPKPSKNSKNR